MLGPAQELGSLPAAELELYKGYGIKQLYKQLHDCNDKLKEYIHVNKKALDQYINFSDQRSELLQRKKELDDGSEAIQNLIDNLDRQKDEAIIRTFRGTAAATTRPSAAASVATDGFVAMCPVLPTARGVEALQRRVQGAGAQRLRPHGDAHDRRQAQGRDG